MINDSRTRPPHPQEQRCLFGNKGQKETERLRKLAEALEGPAAVRKLLEKEVKEKTS